MKPCGQQIPRIAHSVLHRFKDRGVREMARDELIRLG
jgi:hypothetical protein